MLPSGINNRSMSRIPRSRWSGCTSMSATTNGPGGAHDTAVPRKHGLNAAKHFVQGQRVFVRTPDDHKVRSKFPLPWMSSAYIHEEVKPNLFLLRWISPGLGGEAEGALSVSLYSSFQLKAVPLEASTSKLRSMVQLGRSLEEGDEDAVTGRSFYEVEEAIGFRRRGDEVEYLLKWVGYAFSESTWEPASTYVTS